jgi:endonuclease/exonuclease/phosphatase family metal-dependent hydrolase
LNEGPDSATLRELAATWKLANERPMPTIPVDRPRTQIDFVLGSPRERWATRRVEVLDEAVASDHRAILAELTVTGP